MIYTLPSPPLPPCQGDLKLLGPLLAVAKSGDGFVTKASQGQLEFRVAANEDQQRRLAGEVQSLVPLLALSKTPDGIMTGAAGKALEARVAVCEKKEVELGGMVQNVRVRVWGGGRWGAHAINMWGCGGGEGGGREKGTGLVCGEGERRGVREVACGVIKLGGQVGGLGPFPALPWHDTIGPFSSTSLPLSLLSLSLSPEP